MAKRKIAQFRYFGDSNGYLNSTVAGTIYHKMDNNQPASLTSIDLQSGDAFLDYVPIVQLGVQALPGTRFNLNANIDSIVMGVSGMYELDLTNSSGKLTSLTFSKDSLDQIDKNPDGYLIVDIVYEEG